MTHWQTGIVDVDGLAIHYTRTGGVKPSLVLAHGFSDDGLCWTPVTQALEADYDIIMIDARGHGRSDAPESGYSPLDHAAEDQIHVTAGDGDPALRALLLNPPLRPQIGRAHL